LLTPVQKLVSTIIFAEGKNANKSLSLRKEKLVVAFAEGKNANKSLSMGENFSTSARLQVNRRLNKPGRNVTLRGNYSYSYSESESFSLNNVNYFQVAGMATRQQRYSTTPGKNWSYNVNLSYTEPLLKNLFLQLSYSYNQSYSNSDRATYRFDDLADYILEVSPDFTRPELPADLAP
jgi:hypothetical protein